MKTLTTVVLAAALISGCGSVSRQPVEATILEVEHAEESSVWTCNVKTLIEYGGGYRTRICGDYGEPGDTFQGCYISGHWDSLQNGFKTYPCDGHDFGLSG